MTRSGRRYCTSSLPPPATPPINVIPPTDTEKYSWGENYAGSSGLQSPLPHPAVGGWPGGTIDQLEMDRCDQQLTFFPLLANPGEYKPDAVDLTQDKEAR